ncbi:MAG: M67 family metallopeptidase [bacterium]
MALKINLAKLELIKADGEEAYPSECCGFLLGRFDNNDKEVLLTLGAMNAREESEQYHRYLIDPQAFLQGEKFARERNMEIVGFYHSHPDAEARPSNYDLEHGWPRYSYVIVSVKNRRAQEVTSWLLQDDRSKFLQEEIVIESTQDD